MPCSLPGSSLVVPLHAFCTQKSVADAEPRPESSCLLAEVESLRVKADGSLGVLEVVERLPS